MKIYEIVQEKSQPLNEWAWLIPALATAARVGGPAIGRLLSKRGAQQAAQHVARNSGKAVAATGKAIVRNPVKSALAVGGYEVYDTAKEAMEWLEELGVAKDIIKPLADVMVKYAIPATGIIAVLYGGKKLYDYFTDEEPEVTEDLRAWFGKGKKGGAGGGGWDRYNSKGERVGKCGDGKGKGKPKCLSKSAAAKLRNKGGKKAIGSAVNKKRRDDPNKNRRGKAKNVSSTTRTYKSKK